MGRCASPPIQASDLNGGKATKARTAECFVSECTGLDPRQDERTWDLEWKEGRCGKIEVGVGSSPADFDFVLFDTDACIWDYHI